MTKAIAAAVFLVGITALASSQGYDYGQVLGYSLLFYEAQRSGPLPSSNRVPWRGDSMLNDKGENGLDLTGGYFDAGDHVKFGFPMAGTASVLGWGLLDYANGYKKAGEYENGLAALRWATDFFIKAHPSPNELYAQVGDGNIDHAFWGRPEEFTGPRPAFKLSTGKPGSDLAGEAAAMFAISSLVFRAAGDSSYADLCLRHGEELYNFANQYRGKYSDSLPEAGNFYGSSSYGDELTWSAAWLYRATGNGNYLTDARNHYKEMNNGGDFGWNDKSGGVRILMAKVTNETEFLQSSQWFCDYMVFDAKRTPKGLLFLSEWGANRIASNMAFACMQAADLGVNKDAYYAFARQQINYMLGDTGRSYVVGFGQNPPTRPHHRSSSCPNRPEPCGQAAYDNPGPNPQTLYGALVGGPDENDYYEDNRGDYVKNEVATDYNAGFTSALAGLIQAS